MRRFFPFSRVLLVVVALNGAGGIGACSFGGCYFGAGNQGEPSYELRGQILRVNKDEGTVTIRHEDIKGFMPAMTMPFKVRDKRLLDGRARGDLVKGTLVVTDTDAHLIALEVTGHAEGPPSPGEPPTRCMTIAWTCLAPRPRRENPSARIWQKAN